MVPTQRNTLDQSLGCFSLSSSLFVLPVPANSQLKYGAELREYAPAVHIRAVALYLTVCTCYAPRQAALVR